MLESLSRIEVEVLTRRACALIPFERGRRNVVGCYVKRSVTAV